MDKRIIGVTIEKKNNTTGEKKYEVTKLLEHESYHNLLIDYLEDRTKNKKQIIELTIKILLTNGEILLESARYEVGKLLEHELYQNLLMDYLRDSQLTHYDIVYYQILCNDEVVFVSHNRNKIYEKLTKNSLSQKKYENI